MRALVVHPDGTATLHTDAPNPNDLDWMQSQVGGYVEMLQPNQEHQLPGWRAYINEDGRMMDLPANHPATKLVQALGCRFNSNGALVGHVVFVGGAPYEVDHDVPDGVVDFARRQLNIEITER
jgi:hypothetical protein